MLRDVRRKPRDRESVTEPLVGHVHPTLPTSQGCEDLFRLRAYPSTTKDARLLGPRPIVSDERPRTDYFRGVSSIFNERTSMRAEAELVSVPVTATRPAKTK